MRLYHTTTDRAAASILCGGFRDATDTYGFRDEHGRPVTLTGVWFANRPLGVNEGVTDDLAFGSPVLVIAVEETEIAAYELTTVPEAYREWCLPAALATTNLLGVIFEPPSSEEETWWEEMEPTRSLAIRWTSRA